MAGLDQLPSSIRSLRPVKVLEESLAAGRLAHSILFKGEDLAQVEQVALALAHTLLKPRGPVQSHPDFFTLRPAKKARFIVIGDRQKAEANTVRGLLKDLQQTSNQGGYKVAMIYEADRMNPAASNALLKTLEEPPDQTVILLLSTRPYDLLDTIRSRCFQFKIPSRLKSQTLPEWKAWKDDYASWIRKICLDPERGRKNPDEPILMIYGLITRFSKILKDLSDASWKEEAASVDENLSDEEQIALEVGIRKGLRDRLLIEVELATRQAAIQLSHEMPFPALKLTQAVAEIEKLQGLLALNLKDETALESFLLNSMKIWARA